MADTHHTPPTPADPADAGPLELRLYVSRSNARPLSPLQTKPTMTPDQHAHTGHAPPPVQAPPPAAAVDDLAALRVQLDEARETLRALANGEVDAVVMAGPRGTQRVYTLESPDQPYR